VGATPIHVVAARWNVPRAADFTRTFRAAYGLSLGEAGGRARCCVLKEEKLDSDFPRVSLWSTVMGGVQMFSGLRRQQCSSG